MDVTRKLQFIKRNATDKYPYLTNQMFTVTISNVFGVEAWNSYSNVLPRNLQVILAADTAVVITIQYSEILLSTEFNAAHRLS